MNNFCKILFCVLIVLNWGCQENILDQPSQDKVSDGDFFNSGNDLEVAVNDLYRVLPGQSAYLDDTDTDNILQEQMPTRIKGTRIEPTSKGSGGWSWGNLRKINYILENYDRVNDEEREAKDKYSGIARFFRAYFYFDKVKRFGDVPWINKVIKAEDEDDLYAVRDSRNVVMDSIIADIDYAIKHIPAETELFRITKYTALILKSRIALYWGTYIKYHDLDGDYSKYLKLAEDSSLELIEDSPYTLYNTGGASEAYRNLFGLEDQDEQETILAAKFNDENKKHDIGFRLSSPTTGKYGLTKDLVNSYLMKDGSRFTDQDDFDKKTYYEEMQNRDPRLRQTTAGPDFIVPGEDSREPVDLTITRSGYRVIKAMPPKLQWGSGHSTQDIILFRYAEALLNYAEAKAELGIISQNDLDISVNKLRDRVDMPHIKLTDVNLNPDPYQEEMYRNVDKSSNKGIILEIRRERRIEMFFEGLRWDDLMRWKEGKKLEEPMLGLYFPSLGAYDFDNDGMADVYIHDGDDSDAPNEVSSKGKLNINDTPLYDIRSEDKGGTSGNLDPYSQRGSFEEPKDYLYPIPKEEFVLNADLEQNPGWSRE